MLMIFQEQVLLSQKRFVEHMISTSYKPEYPGHFVTTCYLEMYTGLTNYQGLIQAEERHGFEGDGFVYLKNPLWWAGIATRKCRTVSLSLRGLC